MSIIYCGMSLPIRDIASVGEWMSNYTLIHLCQFARVLIRSWQCCMYIQYVVITRNSWNYLNVVRAECVWGEIKYHLWFSFWQGASWWTTVYLEKYAHGSCFAVLCCGYTLTDFPISIRLTSLALWQSNDCPSASKATLMNMDKYLMWIHYERLHNHNTKSTTKPCAYFLGYTVFPRRWQGLVDPT